MLMDNIDRNELIESYLNGALLPEDLLLVETRIANDAAFRADVELQRQLHQEFSDAQKLQLRDLMTDIVREPPPPTINDWIKVMGIAMGIILVAWIIWQRLSTQQATPVPDVPESTQPAPSAPMAEQNPVEEPPKTTDKTPENHIALAYPPDFAPNRAFEDRLGGNIRSSGAAAEMQSPVINADYKPKNGYVQINFRGSAPADTDTAQFPLVLNIYTNLPDATQPVLRLQPIIKNRESAAGKWTFSSVQKLKLLPGLYYFTLERQANEDLIFVGKFTVGRH